MSSIVHSCFYVVTEVSIEGRDLVEKMLERDPKKRIEARRALGHPWIKRHYSNKM